MANKFKPDFNNPYRIDPLYVRMTSPRGTNDGRGSIPSVRDIFDKLSQTSQFKVTLYFGDNAGGQNPDTDLNAWLSSCGVLGDNRGLKYEFMCNETALPGTSLSTSEEVGSRQALTETFASRRVFDPVTMTFYVDSEYGIIRLFEEWMNFINPLYKESLAGSPSGRLTSGNYGGQVDQFDSNQFYRFRYPNTYKRTIAITKFERDIVLDPELNPTGRSPSFLTYRLINAYPVNLTALPVTYEGSTITKTTVTFNYDRYVTLKHTGTSILNSNPSQSDTTANGQKKLLTQPGTSGDNPNYTNTAYGSNTGLDFYP
jgi:hypothetical protein